MRVLGRLGALRDVVEWLDEDGWMQDDPLGLGAVQTDERVRVCVSNNVGKSECAKATWVSR